MGQLALVTGYVPIPGHPRSAKEYGDLGENMFGKLQGDFYVHPFYETVPETWLSKLVNNPKLYKVANVTHSVGDNPAKNTLAYHCVNHQKFAWLLKAAILNPQADTLVWMDYGIGHVPGVTPDVVNEFMAKVQKDDFAVPGCVPKEGLLIADAWPCWRFCGGVIVVPAAATLPLFQLIKLEMRRHIKKTYNVSWEVNTLARCEKHLPRLRWYYADHNETMFTNYGDGLCAASLPVSEAQSDATSTPTSCTRPVGTL